MARCANETCRRWRPNLLVRGGRAGVRFDTQWFCSSTCLAAHTERVLSDTRPPRGGALGRAPGLRLGTLLVHQQAASREAVEVGLRAQRQSGRRLGAQLIAMGLAGWGDVVRALAAQAGVGYLTAVETSRVADGCGDLSREAVCALGVVPFEMRAQEGRLRVACAAPLPRMAMAVLGEMTGCTIEPFVVFDQVFDALMAAYGRARPPARTGPAAVCSLPDAAARVVRAAEQGRAERMRRARCDPFVWVRLDGEGGTEDLVWPLAASREERSWLEERTLR